MTGSYFEALLEAAFPFLLLSGWLLVAGFGADALLRWFARGASRRAQRRRLW